MQAITAGRYGSKMANTRVYSPKSGTHRLSFPLYSVKLYETRVRKKDGAVTWRFVKHLTGGHTWYPTVERRAEAIAEDMGLPYEPVMGHGKVETPPPEPEPIPEPPPVVWDEGNDLLD